MQVRDDYPPSINSTNDACAEEVEQLLALEYNPSTDTLNMNSVNGDKDEIEATIIPGYPTSSKPQKIKKNVFPDSGASICLAGTNHLKQFNFLPQESHAIKE